MGVVDTYPTLIHSSFSNDQLSTGNGVFLMGLLALTLLVMLFLILAITTESRHLWTMISGYTIIALGGYLCLKFCFVATVPGSLITEIIFKGVLYILFGLWHVLVGHACCCGRRQEVPQYGGNMIYEP